jgi:hypothetical protein
MHYEAVLCKPGTESSSPGAKCKRKLASLHLMLALLTGSALTCIVLYSIPPANLKQSWKPRHMLLANLSGYGTMAVNTHGWLPPAMWPPPSPKYTMLVPTFGRTEVLQDLLHTLNKSDCPSLDAIIISWQDIKASIPDFLADGRFSRYPVKVVVPHVNDLNERFRVPSTLRTDAVLQYDDDLRIPCNDLEFAFQLWREEFQDRIVGFTPRSHAMKNGKYIYRMWNKTMVPEHGYSMILTNAAFIHRRYMDAYFLDGLVPAGVRDLVSELLNCEVRLYFVKYMLQSLPFLSVLVALLNMHADAAQFLVAVFLPPEMTFLS